ncbi:hypothetical protein ACFX19_024563 [Malus domestica]
MSVETVLLYALVQVTSTNAFNGAKPSIVCTMVVYLFGPAHEACSFNDSILGNSSLMQGALGNNSLVQGHNCPRTSERYASIDGGALAPAV